MESLPYVYTMEELEALIAEWGFLPFFPNKVRGFSIFDVMDEERIFNDTGDCAWNWKGPIISHWEAAYGKFFGGKAGSQKPGGSGIPAGAGKAGFVHCSWLPDLMNWRRALYPLESYPEEARHILEVLRENESMVSRPLKRASGFTLGRRRRLLPDPDDPSKVIRFRRTGADFDSLINRLQMGIYVCIADFEPAPGRSGESGWQLSVYSTPEAMYDFSNPSDPGFTFADAQADRPAATDPHSGFTFADAKAEAQEPLTRRALRIGAKPVSWPMPRTPNSSRTSTRRTFSPELPEHQPHLTGAPPCRAAPQSSPASASSPTSAPSSLKPPPPHGTP